MTEEELNRANAVCKKIVDALTEDEIEVLISVIDADKFDTVLFNAIQESRPEFAQSIWYLENPEANK